MQLIKTIQQLRLKTSEGKVDVNICTNTEDIYGLTQRTLLN